MSWESRAIGIPLTTSAPTIENGYPAVLEEAVRRHAANEALAQEIDRLRLVLEILLLRTGGQTMLTDEELVAAQHRHQGRTLVLTSWRDEMRCGHVLRVTRLPIDEESPDA